MLIGAPVEVPTASLVKLAERVVNVARELKRHAGATKEWPADHLGTSLAMFSLAVRNVADSGPRSHRDGLRALFAADYPTPPEEPPDPMGWYRAYLDWVAFLSVGDMVLLDAAALALHRADEPPTDNSWGPLMDRLDAQVAAGESPPMARPARQLDVVLRMARNRLVAHRTPGHGGLNQWDHHDSSFQPSLVNPRELPAAYRHLAEANATLPVPVRVVEAPDYGNYADLWERIVTFAGHLDRPARRAVRQATQLYGYDSWPATSTVEAVLALVAAIPPYQAPAERTEAAAEPAPEGT